MTPPAAIDWLVHHSVIGDLGQLAPSHTASATANPNLALARADRAVRRRDLERAQYAQAARGLYSLQFEHRDKHVREHANRSTVRFYDITTHG